MPVIRDLPVIFFSISATTGAVILLLYLLNSRLDRIYAARWKCWLWLLLAVRLMIPLAPSFPGVLIELDEIYPAAVVTGNEDGAEAAAGYVPEELSGSRLIDTQTGAALEKTDGNNESAALQNSTEKSRPESFFSRIFRSFSVSDILVLIWISGFLLFSGYQFMKYHTYKRQILRWSRGVKDPMIIKMLGQQKRQMNITAEIPVLVSRKTLAPMIFGMIHPALILPYEAYTEQELTFVLRHELTHYKRKDPWRKLFFLAVNAVHWFNPAVYLLFQAADADMERFCDDQVTAGTGPEERKAYMETILISADRSRQRKMRENCLSTQINGGVDQLKQRFKNIMDMSRKRCGIGFVSVILISCFAVSGLVGCSGHENAGNTAYAEGIYTSNDNPEGISSHVSHERDSIYSSHDSHEEHSSYSSHVGYEGHSSYSSHNSHDILYSNENATAGGTGTGTETPFDTLEQELTDYFTDLYSILLSDSQKNCTREEFSSVNGYIFAKQLVHTREFYKKAFPEGICQVRLDEVTVNSLTEKDGRTEADVYVKYSYAYGEAGAENRDSTGEQLTVTISEGNGSCKILDINSTSVEVRMVRDSISSVTENAGDTAPESYDAVDRYFEELEADTPSFPGEDG